LPRVERVAESLLDQSRPDHRQIRRWRVAESCSLGRGASLGLSLATSGHRSRRDTQRAHNETMNHGQCSSSNPTDGCRRDLTGASHTTWIADTRWT
jgi:hypothetical protein